MRDLIAKIERSLLAKMLVGGVGTVLLLSLAWYFVGETLRDKENDHVAMHEAAQRAEIAMLQVRRCEKDALMRDVISPAFYETGTGTYMGAHRSALKELYRRIDELRTWRSLIGEAKIAKLEKSANSYAAGFAQVMAARRKLGHANFGLVGRLRSDEAALVQLGAKSGSPELVETNSFLQRR